MMFTRFFPRSFILLCAGLVTACASSTQGVPMQMSSVQAYYNVTTAMESAQSQDLSVHGVGSLPMTYMPSSSVGMSLSGRFDGANGRSVFTYAATGTLGNALTAKDTVVVENGVMLIHGSSLGALKTPSGTSWILPIINDAQSKYFRGTYIAKEGPAQPSDSLFYQELIDLQPACLFQEIRYGLSTARFLGVRKSTAGDQVEAYSATVVPAQAYTATYNMPHQTAIQAMCDASEYAQFSSKEPYDAIIEINSKSQLVSVEGLVPATGFGWISMSFALSHGKPALPSVPLTGLSRMEY